MAVRQRESPCLLVTAGYAVEGETPRLGPMMLLPAKDVESIDTWSVGGMCGTGSHDFAVRDLVVPAAYTLNADAPPLHPGPLYRLPLVLTLCSSLGPLALGIARGAIDCFVELMVAKVDRMTGTGLRDRLTVTGARGQGRGGRALCPGVSLPDGPRDLGNEKGAPLTEQQIAPFRLVNMHAVAASAQAIDLVYDAAGTSAIFTTNLLELGVPLHGGALPGGVEVRA